MFACGLDFGTSNSTIGVVRDGRTELVPVEDGSLLIPTALFFDFATDRLLFGRAAIEAYVGGHEGRLMRGIKSVLGTALIGETTTVKSRQVAFTEVIAAFIRHLKARAEQHCGRELRAVVHGRPVHFVDDDPAADRRAEDALREIARQSGFDEVVFQYEPIAAARHYEQAIDREQIALVADIGGGTSDFSLLRLGPRRLKRAERGDDILANSGIRLGGTDFDRLLSLAKAMPELGMGSPLGEKALSLPRWIFVDLATWARINHLYTHQTLRELRHQAVTAQEPRKIARLLRLLESHQGHELAIKVEEAKIRLSDREEARIDLGGAEPGLAVAVTQAEFLRCIEDELDRLRGAIRRCIALAGLQPAAIDTVLLTGGSTLLPAVRRTIASVVPQAGVVDQERFLSVGLGLAQEARRGFGGGFGTATY